MDGSNPSTQQYKGMNGYQSNKIIWKHYLYERVNDSNGSNEKRDGIFKKQEDFYSTTSFIVCLQTKCRYFASFPSCLDFASFLYEQLQQAMPSHYYEVIAGGRPIKFFFDIDQYDMGLNVVEELLHSIESNWSNVVKHMPFNTNDIRIYSSHGMEEEKQKKSWHIVFPKIICENIRTAEWVARQFVEGMDEQVRLSIDMSVYKSTQQLRLFMCTKYESKRYKKLESKWIYGKYSGFVEQEEMNLPAMVDKQWILFRNYFLESCVSYITSNVTHTTPVIELPREEKERIARFYKIEEDFIPELGSFDPPQGFRIEKYQGNMIILRRHCPSFCQVCGVTHDHDNAFLKWIEEKRQLRFYCRRSNQYNRGGYLVYLYLPNIEEAKEITPATEKDKVNEGRIRKGPKPAGTITNGSRKLITLAQCDLPSKGI